MSPLLHLLLETKDLVDCITANNVMRRTEKLYNKCDNYKHDAQIRKFDQTNCNMVAAVEVKLRNRTNLLNMSFFLSSNYVHPNVHSSKVFISNLLLG